MRLLSLVAATALAAALASTAQAQQHMNMPGMGGAPAATGMAGMDMDEVKSRAPYHPGLNELMTELVQPHHIKLGLAGAAGNWAYAAYELDALSETFDEVGKLVLQHGALRIAPAIAATVKPPMEALQKAIAARDAAAFKAAYAQLTDACNACHKSAGHAMIVVRVPPPEAAAFPDQDFAPPK